MLQTKLMLLKYVIFEIYYTKTDIISKGLQIINASFHEFSLENLYNGKCSVIFRNIMEDLSSFALLVHVATLSVDSVFPVLILIAINVKLSPWSRTDCLWLITIINPESNTHLDGKDRTAWVILLTSAFLWKINVHPMLHMRTLASEAGI